MRPTLQTVEMVHSVRTNCNCGEVQASSTGIVAQLSVMKSAKSRPHKAASPALISTE